MFQIPYPRKITPQDNAFKITPLVRSLEFAACDKRIGCRRKMSKKLSPKRPFEKDDEEALNIVVVENASHYVKDYFPPYLCGGIMPPLIGAQSVQFFFLCHLRWLQCALHVFSYVCSGTANV